MFVNRTRELQFLEQHYASGQAELLVVYGRRRVGKTDLLRHFCNGKPHIFFVADLGTEENLLSDLTRQISEYFLGDPLLLAPFTTWESAFAYIATQAKERMVLVLDEFTYLIAGNSAFPSTLQKVWDTQLRAAPILLALSGSYIGMMEQSVLAYRSPLYGRRTGQWRLQPFTIWDARALVPGLSAEALVHVFAILGGMPAYLRQYDTSLALLGNVEQKILARGAFLHDEPRFLLQQELRDSSRHFAILTALANHRTRVNEIAQASGIPVTSVTFYLNTLQEMGLITRLTPATERNPERSRQGIYQIADPFFRFWFRYVYPNRSLLERGETEQVQRKVEIELEQFTGPVFETICREYVWRLHENGRLGFTPHTVGGWWSRHDEIDVAAIGEDGCLLGECKWTAKPIGVNILDQLTEKTKAVQRLLPETPIRLALFARSGFTLALHERARNENILLVDLSEIIG